MTVQALAAGSLQFGSGGPEPYIEASERGLDFVVIGGIINGIAQFLIAGKNYKTYEDLRGATFGTASLTGGTITALREALKLKGLEYPRDYKLLIVAGGSSANLAALQSGQIAATTVAVPLNYAAEESGLQHYRPAERRHCAFSDECFRDATLVGGEESAGDGAFHESDGANVSLDVRKPRSLRSNFCRRRCSLSRCTRAKAGSFTRRIASGRRTVM